MENEMIMNNVEENNTVVDLNNEETSAGAKAAVVAVVAVGVGAVVAAAYGIKWLAGKAKKAWNERKEKKIREAEFVDLGENQNDSEESD